MQVESGVIDLLKGEPDISLFYYNENGDKDYFSVKKKYQMGLFTRGAYFFSRRCEIYQQGGDYSR